MASVTATLWNHQNTYSVQRNNRSSQCSPGQVHAASSRSSFIAIKCHRERRRVWRKGGASSVSRNSGVRECRSTKGTEFVRCRVAAKCLRAPQTRLCECGITRVAHHQAVHCASAEWKSQCSLPRETRAGCHHELLSSLDVKATENGAITHHEARGATQLRLEADAARLRPAGRAGSSTHKVGGRHAARIVDRAPLRGAPLKRRTTNAGGMPLRLRHVGPGRTA